MVKLAGKVTRVYALLPLSCVSVSDCEHFFSDRIYCMSFHSPRLRFIVARVNARKLVFSPVAAGFLA
jgi:hypothetical protein